MFFGQAQEKKYRNHPVSDKTMKKTAVVKNVIIYLIICACFAASVKYVFFEESGFGIPVVIGCSAAFAGLLIFDLLSGPFSGGINKSAVFFSVVFTLCVNVGKSLYYKNSFEYIHASAVNGILFVISLVGFFAAAYSLCSFFFRLLKNEKGEERCYAGNPLYRMNSLARFFIVWACIFLLWLPVYLAYYPGVFSYDIPNQTSQVFRGFSDGMLAYNLNHPPLHTFVWGLCINIEKSFGINAVVVYSISQMLLLSGVCAKLIHLLFYREVRFWIIIVSFLFFSVNPVVALFSFSITKDVYFACFLLLTVIDIVYLVKEPEKYVKMPGFWVSFIIHSALAVLFRNNALYVFIVLVPIAVIMLIKYWKYILPLFVLPVVISWLVTNVGFVNMGIQPGDLGETASIPSQQIAKVVKYEDPVEFKDEIDKYLPYDTIGEKYNPRFSDPVKYTFKKDYFENNTNDFYKLWFTMLKKYPSYYVSSFLDLNLPYWYPFADSVDKYAQRKYIETDIRENEYYTPVRQSFFPGMLRIYERIADFSAFEKIPTVINIFSLQFPIWALFFCFCVLLTKGRGKKQIILSPYFLLWLTYILGPVSNFRYIFPVFIAYPLLLALIFDTDKLTDKRENALQSKL